MLKSENLHFREPGRRTDFLLAEKLGRNNLCKYVA